MAKDPLIAVADRNPVGEASSPTSDFALYDKTYVEGYSDVRRRGGVPGLRLHWVRAQTPAGRPDGQDIASHKMQGYDFITKATLDKYGIKEPASGQIDPTTGRYLLGDTVLMGCTREVAARNENVLRRATEAAATNEATSSALDAEGKRVGRSLGQDMLTESSVKHELRGAP